MFRACRQAEDVVTAATAVVPEAAVVSPEAAVENPAAASVTPVAIEVSPPVVAASADPTPLPIEAGKGPESQVGQPGGFLP